MKRDARDARVATRAVWAGEEESLLQGATQVPIAQSVAFGYDDLDDWQQVALGQKAGYIYSRNTNPTVAALEAKVRILEGAEAATSMASGMAAISNTIFSLVRSGDRIVTVKDTYGGTNQLFREFLPQIDVTCCLCNTTDFATIEAEISKGCKLLYLETPTNPTLKVIDIERLTRKGHEAGVIVVTDNTFATPINQHPLQLGSDLVIHSASKYLGGHADALGGIVCGRQELIHQVFHYREITGGGTGPVRGISAAARVEDLSASGAATK